VSRAHRSGALRTAAAGGAHPPAGAPTATGTAPAHRADHTDTSRSARAAGDRLRHSGGRAKKKGTLS
jgi:hypothetical protein